MPNNTITEMGNWSLVSPRVQLLALVLLLPAVSVCQSQTDRPTEFEVVSVKRQPTERTVFVPGPRPRTFITTGRRFTDRVVSVRQIILQAFDVTEYQVQGLPDWANPAWIVPGGEYYDIDAVAPFDDPTTPELRIMLQSVLAERFNLRWHWQEKELPVYAVVAARRGLKFEPVPAGSSERGMTMYQLIQEFSAFVGDRPLVDHTGLEGRYIVSRPGDLSHVRDEPLHAASELSAIFEDRYGLKLEARKELIRVLVVDHIERPSPN